MTSKSMPGPQTRAVVRIFNGRARCRTRRSRRGGRTERAARRRPRRERTHRIASLRARGVGGIGSSARGGGARSSCTNPSALSAALSGIGRQRAVRVS